MIIKKAKYKKVVKEVTERISDDVYGCDECKKEIVGETLRVDVFFQNSDPTVRHEFCSWACTLKFIPKIKSDHFVSLPFLHYDSQSDGTNAADFIKLISK